MITTIRTVLISLLASLILLFSFHAKRVLLYPTGGKGFRTEQQKNARVKTAYEKTWPTIAKRLKQLGVDETNFQLLIRGFKDEGELEVWVKSSTHTTFQLYTTFSICAPSGELGPKRCQGDGQVPEGFYHVNIFNPTSNYHLSLGVSYPNASDKVFACKRDPGGAIMIHGNCVTIGCIPITDEKIRELYVLAVEAKNSGQAKIPIHLFPARLTADKLKQIKANQPDAKIDVFWDNLKTGYDWFESNKRLPTVSIDTKGKYSFQ